MSWSEQSAETHHSRFSPQQQSVQYFPKQRDRHEWEDRQTDSWTDRWEDRQTDRGIPVVEGGVGDEGHVGGELAPEPEGRKKNKH